MRLGQNVKMDREKVENVRKGKIRKKMKCQGVR
jgi:hypothetical protein